MNGDSGRGCFVVLFNRVLRLGCGESHALKIDAPAIFFPVPESSRLRAITPPDFFLARVRAIFRLHRIPLVACLVGHFGFRNGRRNGLLAGRHNGVVCQRLDPCGTPAISQVTMDSFGFSE